MSSKRYDELNELSINSYELDCPVEIENGKLLLDTETNLILLLMKLRSISTVKINSVFIEITGLDAAGDLLGEKSIVHFTYTDLFLDQYESFGDKTPIILDQNVRRVLVKITKVAFQNAEPWRSNEGNTIKLIHQDPLSELGLDKEKEFHRLVKALNLPNGDQTKYLPISNKEQWICSCGRTNKSIQKTCLRCGIEKEWLLKNIRPDVLKSSLIENQKQEVEEAKRRRIESEIEEINNKKEKIKIEELNRVKKSMNRKLEKKH